MDEQADGGWVLMRVWRRDNHSVQVEVVGERVGSYLVRADGFKGTWVVKKLDFEPIPARYLEVPPSQTYSEGLSEEEADGWLKAWRVEGEA